jgi:ankyrin repeat protein
MKVRFGFCLFCCLVLCVAGSAAQSFDSLKKTVLVFDATLNTLLGNNDVEGMEQYLRSDTGRANNASFRESIQGVGAMPVVRMKPLLYDAVSRVLQGSCSVGMCEVIVRTGCNLNIAYDGKTPIYAILDYLATHTKDKCETAERLLSVFASRTDFDVNYRHKSLLPPLAYLIRENHRFLGRFNKAYLSDNVIKLLLDKGAPVNTFDDEGNSLMTFAIDTDNEFLQTYFISNGTDLAKKNKAGRDVMYKAIAEGRLELIEQLLSNGYSLGLRTLENDPSSFRRFPATYDYLTALFADQIATYDDIQLYIKKFNDKFGLVQPKLYAIYLSEYRPVEDSRNLFLSLIKTKPDVYAVADGVHEKRDFAASAGAFISRHSGYDPDNKVGLAKEIADIYTLCDGLRQRVRSTYMVYYEVLFGLLDSGYTMKKDEAMGLNALLDQCIAIADRLYYTSGIGVQQFFAEAEREVRAKSNLLATTWNNDVVRWNQYVEKRNAKLEADRKRFEAEQQARRCAECEVDWSKSRYPKRKTETIMEIFEYTKETPGELVMKNGEKYTFYWDNDDKEWYISTGFLQTEEFSDWEKMVKYFLEECEKKYCR